MINCFPKRKFIFWIYNEEELKKKIYSAENQKFIFFIIIKDFIFVFTLRYLFFPAYLLCTKWFRCRIIYYRVFRSSWTWGIRLLFVSFVLTNMTYKCKYFTYCCDLFRSIFDEFEVCKLLEAFLWNFFL